MLGDGEVVGIRGQPGLCFRLRAKLRDNEAARREPVKAPRPQSMQPEVTYYSDKKIDAFDEEMERQLQEAMGGMSPVSSGL